MEPIERAIALFHIRTPLLVSPFCLANHYAFTNIACELPVATYSIVYYSQVCHNAN